MSCRFNFNDNHYIASSSSPAISTAFMITQSNDNQATLAAEIARAFDQADYSHQYAENTRDGRLRKPSRMCKPSRASASSNHAPRSSFISSNNMPEKPLTILAIDPGTKEIGFAVFSGAQLEYYGVKTFKRRSPAFAFLAEV